MGGEDLPFMAAQGDWLRLVRDSHVPSSLPYSGSTQLDPPIYITGTRQDVWVSDLTSPCIMCRCVWMGIAIGVQDAAFCHRTTLETRNVCVCVCVCVCVGVCVGGGGWGGWGGCVCVCVCGCALGKM